VVHAIQHGVGAGQGFQNLLANAACQLGSLRRFAVQAFQHHHKFVATQACHGIARSQAVIQPQCHFLQQAVAHIVAQGIVEGFEVVQVDKQQGTGFLVVMAVFQRHLQPVLQQAAVGQLGERVVEGQPLDLVFSRLALGDVAHGGYIVADAAVVTQYGADAEPFRVDFPVFTPVPDFALPCP
jgi:hypothetical protein